MMSNWLGFVLIQGDHLSDIDKFFEVYGYEKHPTIKDDVSDSYRLRWGSVFESFAICVLKGWTVICDAPLNIVDIGGIKEQQMHLRVASFILKTKIYCMQYQDQSFVSQFFIVDNGELVRGVFMDEGKTKVNIGCPLPIESNLNLFDDNDAFKVMEEVTGISNNDIYNNSKFIVKTYDSRNRYI